MKKHYVKIMSGGKTIADALIEAESPSAAVKQALRGEGIDLSRVRPDESYTVVSDGVTASSFGDEFAQTADYSGDDKPNFSGHLHAKPIDLRRTGIYPGVDAWPGGREALGDFIADKVFQKAIRDFRDGVIRRIERQKILADAYAGNPADVIERILNDEGLQVDHEAIAKAREFFDSTYPQVKHVNCRSQVAPITTTLEFDFDCDCGTVTRHKFELEGVASEVNVPHSCSGCGANHVTRIER